MSEPRASYNTNADIPHIEIDAAEAEKMLREVFTGAMFGLIAPDAAQKQWWLERIVLSLGQPLDELRRDMKLTQGVQPPWWEAMIGKS